MDLELVLVFFVILIALGGLSNRYGVDSRERIDSTREGVLGGNLR
jgi:hypothetical protein